MTKLTAPLALGRATIRNRVFLAPMSGVTDLPFRERAWQAGAGLVVSEMIASGELTKGRQESARRLRRAADAPHVVQIAGRETAAMAAGARIAEGEGADIIDINMGCPAKKVTGGYSGSALMRDLDHAVSLIDAVVGAVDVPVTVKMRLGWNDANRNAPLLAARAEQSGAAMITVHGRTRCQFYEGRADWAAIASVKQAIGIPLVANGDVRSLQDADELLRLSGADAVMLGRASYGAPWLAGEIVGQASHTSTKRIDDMVGYVTAHYEDMLSYYGVERGLRHARKHLGWYLSSRAPATPAELRERILRSTDTAEVRSALSKAFCLDLAEPLRAAA